MDHGKIVEVGTHAELMDRRGFYFDMVERQWRAFAPAVAATQLAENDAGLDAVGGVGVTT